MALQQLLAWGRGLPSGAERRSVVPTPQALCAPGNAAGSSRRDHCCYAVHTLSKRTRAANGGRGKLPLGFRVWPLATAQTLLHGTLMVRSMRAAQAAQRLKASTPPSTALQVSRALTWTLDNAEQLGGSPQQVRQAWAQLSRLG